MNKAPVRFVPLALLFRINLRFPARGDWPAVFAAGFFETAGFACITIGAILVFVDLLFVTRHHASHTV